MGVCVRLAFLLFFPFLSPSLASSQDRPGIVTGWWQQSTIDAFRLLTLEGISKAVGFKKAQIAAAEAASSQVIQK